jgi:hypothetical protein
MSLMVSPMETQHRLRRSLWATVAFLGAFGALIVIVANYFLIPAADAARTADTVGKRQLSAVAMLLLAILLVIMLIGLLMTFRIRRFFQPAEPATRTKTEHIDAWAESARRMTAPPTDDDEDDPDTSDET